MLWALMASGPSNEQYVEIVSLPRPTRTVGLEKGFIDAIVDCDQRGPNGRNAAGSVLSEMIGAEDQRIALVSETCQFVSTVRPRQRVVYIQDHSDPWSELVPVWQRCRSVMTLIEQDDICLVRDNCGNGGCMESPKIGPPEAREAAGGIDQHLAAREVLLGTVSLVINEDIFGVRNLQSSIVAQDRQRPPAALGVAAS